MPSCFSAAALLLVLAAAPSAQPVLTVSADPYDGSGTAPLVFGTVGTTAVSIDSLRIAPGEGVPDYRGIFATLTVTGSGPARTTGADCGRYRTCRDQITSSMHLAETLAAGETLELVITEYCGLCHRAGEQRQVSVDTLLLYHAGRPEPLRVRISGYRAPVAGEAGPSAAALSVSVLPTPASGPSTVRVAVAEGAVRAAVLVVDALGRRVAVLHDGPLAAGDHAFTLDASALPAGVYVVRVEAGEATESARLVVVR